ncbi:hypothetical protein BGZ47_000084 [Haplosporangium gracile]|nr:hypothetical protein BGZ47_000084 [Haplosporangium gracile]
MRLNDLSLLAPKYRIPRPATVSPILHAVMSAASNGLSSNNFYGNSPEDEDEDVPVLNLALQPSAVPRNAAREVNTESSSSHNQPQSPRTANESENIRRGKQTDRSIRDSQRQIVQKQILEHDQIQEILEDYYIDEEQIVDEDEYDDDREAKGKGEFATGDDDTQALILNGKDKKKKKKTLLQRAKNALSKKLKKTSETG